MRPKSWRFQKTGKTFSKVEQNELKQARCWSEQLLNGALEDDNYVVMSSLDFNVAFVVVNIDLLIKRWKIIGLTQDVIDLISVWLIQSSGYVSINGNNFLLAFYPVLSNRFNGLKTIDSNVLS